MIIFPVSSSTVNHSVLFFLLFLMTDISVAADADSLLIPINELESNAANNSRVVSPPGQSKRRTNINIDLVARMKTSQNMRVAFPLGDNRQWVASFNKGTGTLGAMAWSGSIEGKPLGFATMVAFDNVIAVSLSDGKTDILVEQSDGKYFVIERGPEYLGTCDTISGDNAGASITKPINENYLEPVLEIASASPTANAISIPPVSYVDVLALYTDDVLSAAGSVSAVKSAILLRENYATSAHKNSGTELRFRLVGIVPVNYVENGKIDEIRAWLRNPSDGVMDEAHALRDRYGADIVSLFVNTKGTTTSPSTVGQADLPGAWGVVKWDEGVAVFAHEVGHNLGLCHERINPDGNPDPDCDDLNPDGIDEILDSFAHAWEAVAILDNGFTDLEVRARSVMWSVVGGSTVPYFSNPTIAVELFDSFHCSGGILCSAQNMPIGTSDSDNARSVEFGRRSVSARRRNSNFWMSPNFSIGGSATTFYPSHDLSYVESVWIPNTETDGSDAARGEARFYFTPGNYPNNLTISTPMILTINPDSSGTALLGSP